MKTIICISAISSLLFFSACNKPDSPGPAQEEGNGAISFRLTDSPGNFQQVNVDVQQVSVHLVSTGSNGAWINLPTNAGIYDLLKLQNGTDTLVVDTLSLPAGKITQVRLLLGTQNTVMEDSVLHPLTVPSGTQTGIKLNGPFTLAAGDTLNVLLDFDANESVVKQGNGGYHLKPVIRVIP